MTYIDIFSGFLGAGKTTLIKKLIREAYQGQKVVLIENEFGEIGIDGGFLREAGIEITEMNSGCICCSLVGDFGRALEKVVRDFAPDRILIEPSGVGKLSDVVAAARRVTNDQVQLGAAVTVADATRCKMYMKNFGEFYNNQVETAGTILLSRTGSLSPEKLEQAVALLREKNPRATIVTTPWEQLTGAQIVEAMRGSLDSALAALVEEEHHAHEHAHEHDHDHHHDHDHEHDHDHDHHGHHHHHADEVFSSWGAETAQTYSETRLREILTALGDEAQYGLVLRAKGYVAAPDGGWLHFDLVPGEAEVRPGTPEPTGRVCVIGSKLHEAALAALFAV